MLDLKFSLTSNWLVKTDLYEQLSKKNGNKWSTDYASKKINLIVLSSIALIPTLSKLLNSSFLM